MAEQTWRPVRIENGKTVILFADGKEVPMTDEEYQELKNPKPVAKAAKETKAVTKPDENKAITGPKETK